MLRVPSVSGSRVIDKLTGPGWRILKFGIMRRGPFPLFHGAFDCLFFAPLVFVHAVVIVLRTHVFHHHPITMASILCSKGIRLGKYTRILDGRRPSPSSGRRRLTTCTGEPVSCTWGRAARSSGGYTLGKNRLTRVRDTERNGT